MVKIEKFSQDIYQIKDNNNTICFPKEKFEDLYYAVPLNSSNFLRLLQDHICTNSQERHTLNSMLDIEGDRGQILDNLQKQIQEMSYP
ncbi:MAG: hypothetical protein HUU50_04305 [Candidatus Brocadiae bacterium]|nr:hypothetical protein [Candidatus Brocadiia bacterium]